MYEMYNYRNQLLNHNVNLPQQTSLNMSLLTRVQLVSNCEPPVTAIVCISMLVIIVLMLIFLRKRIIVAIGILKFTSRSVEVATFV